jgi:FixJ family two-component response regulator
MKMILLIDDDLELRKSLRSTLSLIDADVQEASNGIEALASIKQQLPDVIVTDIRMPEMDGFDFAEQLMLHKINIPIIFVSGYVDKEIAIQAFRMGCFDLLEKPFNAKELQECVKEALENADDLLFEKLRTLTLNTLQAKILETLLRGGSNKEIAHSVNLSEQGVKYHISSLLKKFSSINRKELKHKVWQLVEKQTSNDL